MAQVIIFEGPDRSGKTTISDAVAKRFGTEVFMTNSKECFTERAVFSQDSSNIAMFNHYLARYVNELVHDKKVGKPIFIYRSFLSELVYSELLGRETDMVSNTYTDYLFSGMDALIVICKNKRESYSDDTLKDDMINYSYELYDKYKGIISTKFIEIDTGEQKVDEYVDLIASHITIPETIREEGV